MGQAIDPLDVPGNWHANASFAALDSQATQVTGVNGLTGGGLDDRFDFQLVSAMMLNGPGTKLIPGSYHVFGNNGTTFNGNINSPGNTALPLSEYSSLAGQPTPPTCWAAPATASDHLPLVADYMVPEPSTLALGLLAIVTLAGFRLQATRRGRAAR